MVNSSGTAERVGYEAALALVVFTMAAVVIPVVSGFALRLFFP
jgi:hypothetical protein